MVKADITITTNKATVNTGLSDSEVVASRRQYGTNVFTAGTNRTFIHVLKEIVTEPMFIILLAACTIYFLMHQYEEGFIMLIAIFIVAGISLFQEYRSRNAVEALEKLSAPKLDFSILEESFPLLFKGGKLINRGVNS